MIAAGEGPMEAGALQRSVLDEFPEPCLILTENGVVAVANKAAESLMGQSLSPGSRCRIHEFMDADSIRRLIALRRDASLGRATSEPERFEGSLAVPGVQAEAAPSPETPAMPLPAATESSGIRVHCSVRAAQTAGGVLLFLQLYDARAVARERQDLMVRVAELEKFQRFFLERETRIIELKERVAELERQLGLSQPPVSDDIQKELRERLERST